MRHTNVEAVRVFREVLGVTSSLIQKIINSLEEAYLLDIRNRISNSITVKIAEPLTRLRENYGQLIPREHLEREGMTTNKS